jgi:spoIIIJ-associated protein
VVAVSGNDNSGSLMSAAGAEVGADLPATDPAPGQPAADATDTGAVTAAGTGPAAGANGNEAGESGGAEGSSEAEEAEADGPADEAAVRKITVADLEQESEIAADYIEGLLDVADLDGDIDMDVEGDRPVVSVVGATLDELVGAKGEVLEALQELTRLAVHRQTGGRSRIMLDVSGYRAKRRQELTALGSDAAAEVAKTGVPRRMAAMTPFERKIVHDAVAAAGLRSESEGEEPERRVVVFPAG